MTRALEQRFQVRIPDRVQLEEHYTPDEVEVLGQVRAALPGVTAPLLEWRQAWDEGRQLLHSIWPDERTWLSKTTWIVDRADNREKLLKPKKSQERLLDLLDKLRAEKKPIRIVICKARQLGMSTLLQALHYMWCDLNPLRNSMTLSHSEPAAKDLFRKAWFMHKRHFFPRPQSISRRDQIEFDEPHHSTFVCHTANNPDVTRGLSLQHAHLSEVPFWDDAESTLTAIHQCVALKPETSIIYESTAQGAVGAFYDTWQRAVQGRNNFVPFFAPWFWEEDYSLPFATASSRNAFLRKLSKDDSDYMERYDLTAEQMQWRRWKINSELHGNERLWDQEFPAEAEHAFLTSGSPVFDMGRIFAMKDRVRAPDWCGQIFLEHELPPHREPGGPVPRVE